jgi:hypothetical protein
MEDGVHSQTNMNSLGEALTNWYNSEEFKDLQDRSEKEIQRCVGKYHMLSDSDKYDMVQAICYIICKSEREGTSHRGLMSDLGIYPEGFWIDGLMDIHNALYTEFSKQRKE